MKSWHTDLYEVYLTILKVRYVSSVKRYGRHISYLICIYLMSGVCVWGGGGVIPKVFLNFKVISVAKISLTK
jgi:hypothetical protein